MHWVVQQNLLSPLTFNALQNARQQAARWQPNRAFAIDVGQTSVGLKILELNSANSEGFYACDLGLIVDAVERLACQLSYCPFLNVRETRGNSL